MHTARGDDSHEKSEPVDAFLVLSLVTSPESSNGGI